MRKACRCHPRRSGSIVCGSCRSDFSKPQVNQRNSFRTRPRSCCTCCNLFPFNSGHFQLLPVGPYNMDATCRDEFAACARRTGIRKRPAVGWVRTLTRPPLDTTHHLGKCVITDYKIPKKIEWHDSARFQTDGDKCHVHRVRLLTNQERDEHTRQLSSTRSAPLAGTAKIVVFVTHDTAAASSCDARHSGGGQSKLV